MGMAYRDGYTGEMERRCPADGRLWVEKRGIVTSGSLLPLTAYERVGPFREDFFIDAIDYVFCMRARAKGFRVVKVCRLGMTHCLGHMTKHRVLGIRVETYNYSPVRRYYFCDCNINH